MLKWGQYGHAMAHRTVRRAALVERGRSHRSLQAVETIRTACLPCLSSSRSRSQGHPGRPLGRNSDARLITLTGAGGNGKTRLAIEVARRLINEFNGCAWFAPLADLPHPRLIPEAVFDALCLSRSADVEPLEQVIGALSKQPSLVVLDNVEHLIGKLGNWETGKLRDEETQFPNFPISQFSQLILTLLERAPTLKLLVTSRQPLSLIGEHEFAVPPLPLPDSCCSSRSKRGR